MTKSEMFKSAHAATKLAMAEQKEIKHPSAHKSYQQLFDLCLRGAYGAKKAEAYVPVEQVKFMWLRGV